MPLNRATTLTNAKVVLAKFVRSFDRSFENVALKISNCVCRALLQGKHQNISGEEVEGEEV